MKFRRLTALLLCICIAASLFAGCTGKAADADSSSEAVREPGCNLFTLYWSREGVDYEKSDVWIWFDSAEGRGYAFTPCDDGVVCVVNVPDTVKKLGYIVRYDCSDPCGTSWGTATKDYDEDRFVTMDGDVTIRVEAGKKEVTYLVGSEAAAGGTAYAGGGFADEAVITDVSFSSDYVTDDNNRVFYEIFVGGFSDSDGDGIGDLRGIINRFDYLNDGDPTSGKSLGVEGIWLMPIYESPSYHKYDVTDYYTIDSDYGTMDDLRELAALCEERNVKLILDLPINHTGSSNAWFSSFVSAHKAGDTEDPYYDFYSWCARGEQPAGRTFLQIDGCSDCYECNFDSSMPELNYDNPAVREEMLKVAEYWLDAGVDGFRFDASKYIYYGDTASSADFWEEYLGTLRQEYPGIYTVHEVWEGDSVTFAYNGSGSCFDFSASGSEGLIATAAKKGDVNRYTAYVRNYLAELAERGEYCLYTPFLANHDMDRAAGYLTIASGYAQMGANLYLLGPGSPFIYYGEEIGMKGSRGGADTDSNRRLAMLWGDGDTVEDPTGSTYDRSKQTNGTVADQISDPDSLYSYYKKVLLIRAANPEIARGTYEALELTDTKAGGFIAEWNGNSVIVIHNTSGSAVTLDLSAYLTGNESITAAIGFGDNGAALNGTTLTLDAQTSCVIR